VAQPIADNRLHEPLATSIERVAADWRDLVAQWRGSAAGRKVIEHVQARGAAGATIYPADPLRALALTPRAAVRVVIVGQDPYHGPGQAEGLAFSVPDGVRAPPSLRNIGVELQRDIGSPGLAGTSLVGWARQGVLLLNTVLTVEDGRPASHTDLGWEALTDAVIQSASKSDAPIVFMLWGAHAAGKRLLVDGETSKRHLVLMANHPSPLSARRGPTPFVGCGHFGQANAFLSVADPRPPPIDWRA
jgi:uracil-DNA glycosylase